MFLALMNTLEIAIVGFLFGALLALLFAYLTYQFYFLDKLIGGVIFFLYAFPLIILVWIVHGTIPQPRIASYLFVSIVVIFPIYNHVRRGLDETPSSYIDSVFVHGGKNKDALKYVQIWSAIPNFLSALQASWSAAFLAALISDFASGIQPNFGSLIIGSISHGSIQSKLFVAIICTAVGYIGHRILGKLVIYSQKKYTLDAPENLNITVKKKNQSYFDVKFLTSKVLKYIFWPLIFWFLYSMFFSYTLPAKNPQEIAIFFFNSLNGSQNIEILFSALKLTVFHSFVGLLAVIILVYFLSAIMVLNKTVNMLINPALIFFQATPIIAWLGLLRLIESPLLLAVVTSITASIFPAYIFIKNRLISPPSSFIMPVNVFGGQRMDFFRYIQVPLMIASIPEVISVVAPRVMLGVMLAEYFLTYKGLGGLVALNYVGGDREYWWGILIVVGIVSLFFYSIQKLTQNLLLK